MMVVDIIRVEAVEVEELGIGQELQVAIWNIDVAGQLMTRGDGVQVGEILRHVWGAAAIVVLCRHNG